jgi:hypothetical protein
MAVGAQWVRDFVTAWLATCVRDADASHWLGKAALDDDIQTALRMCVVPDDASVRIARGVLEAFLRGKTRVRVEVPLARRYLCMGSRWAYGYAGLEFADGSWGHHRVADLSTDPADVDSDDLSDFGADQVPTDDGSGRDGGNDEDRVRRRRRRYSAHN